MAHSRGPWYADKGSGGQGLVIQEGSGRTIALAYDEKNAPVIAAAPDLEELVRRALEIIQDGASTKEVKAFVRAAQFVLSNASESVQ